MKSVTVISITMLVVVIVASLYIGYIKGTEYSQHEIATLVLQRDSWKSKEMLARDSLKKQRKLAIYHRNYIDALKQKNDLNSIKLNDARDSIIDLEEKNSVLHDSLTTERANSAEQLAKLEQNIINYNALETEYYHYRDSINSATSNSITKIKRVVKRIFSTQTDDEYKTKLIGFSILQSEDLKFYGKKSINFFVGAFFLIFLAAFSYIFRKSREDNKNRLKRFKRR